MLYGAIDLHSRQCQIRIVDETGAVVCDTRVPTERTRLVRVFDGRGSMRVLVEAGTESEWVAQGLEAAGHTVVVADPNYAPMYGERHRRVKTDRRDAAALAEANRRGWYRAAHRRSATQRGIQQQLRVRRQLVGMRSGTIAVLRALVRQDGYRVPTGSAAYVPARLAGLELPSALTARLAPLVRTIESLTQEITALNRQVAAIAAADPVAPTLQTVPGVAAVVAVTFRATIDRIDRFQHAGQVSALLGLVPREDSSGDRRHRGHLTKCGSAELRSLLVQAAWACWRSRRSGR
jgi:transposase